MALVGLVARVEPDHLVTMGRASVPRVSMIVLYPVAGSTLSE